MEGNKRSACLILSGLTVVAAIAGFAAEATRNKYAIIDYSTATCTYASRPARALGIFAMVILCIIQILFNVTTGCACFCRRKPSPNGEIVLNSNPTLEIIFLVVSWGTFVGAFVMFMQASVVNLDTAVDDSCLFIKRGWYAGATLLTLVCAGCGIGYINLVFRGPPVGMNNGTEAQYGQPGSVPVEQPQQQYGQPGFIPGQPQQQYGGQVQLGHKQPAQYPPSNQLQPY